MMQGYLHIYSPILTTGGGFLMALDILDRVSSVVAFVVVAAVVLLVIVVPFPVIFRFARVVRLVPAFAALLHVVV